MTSTPFPEDTHVQISRTLPDRTTVAIVGGGPAGSTAATILARQGIEVVLLDREVFPRYHIGESLLPSMMVMADILGCREELEAYGFIRKPGAYFEWGAETWTLRFGELGGIPQHTFQVVRSEFDHFLLGHARRQGAAVFENVAVEEVLFENGRARALNYVDRETGQTGRMAFAQLIDCSGRHGLLAEQTFRNRQTHHVFRNVALWSYWRNADIAALGDEGTIRVLSIPDGWIWMIPLHDGTLSVGVVLHVDQFKQLRATQDLAEVYGSILRSQPSAAAALELATRSDVKMETDYSYTCDRFSGPGYFIAGDAACFLDPLLSSGVHLATLSGLLSAAAVTSTLREDVSEAEAATYYETSYRQAYLRFLVFVSAFYDQNRTQRGYFWQAQQLSRHHTSAAQMKSAFISLVSGLEDYGELQEFEADIVLGKIGEQLRENLALRLDKTTLKAPSEAAQENARFMESVEGLFVLSKESAVGGFYVEVDPEVRLKRVTQPVREAAPAS